MARVPRPSGEQFEIRYGTQRAVAVELGAGLREYEVAGWQVLDGYPEDQMASAARGHLLIPWPNRIADGRYRFDGQDIQLALSEPGRQNAIHGLIRWSPFRLVDRSPSRVRLEHLLYPHPGYPFSLRTEVEYELSEDGLTVTISAENAGTVRLPYGAGQHPYIRTGGGSIDEFELQVPAPTRLQSDDRGIPTGRARVDGTEYDFRRPRRIGSVRLDTAYTDLTRGPDGRAEVIVGAEGGRRVTVWAGPQMSHLMIFTGDALPEAERRRQGLGVEPMTCAPDAFRSGEGLTVIEPGGRFSCGWGVRVSSEASSSGALANPGAAMLRTGWLVDAGGQGAEGQAVGDSGPRVDGGLRGDQRRGDATHGPEPDRRAGAGDDRPPQGDEGG